MITNEMMQPWSMELETEENKSPKAHKGLVQGVGTNDMTDCYRRVDGKEERHPCYVSWKGLLERTYCPKYKETRPQRYAEVADEWKTLSGFYPWWKDQPFYPDGNLDSDLLSAAKGLPKAYTSATACFVPARINSLLSARENDRGGLPQGVTHHRKGYRAQLSKGPEGKWRSSTTHDLAEALDYYWKEKPYYALTTAYDLLEGHPERDDLMLGIKITLRNQHEEACRHLNEALECQQMKAQQ